MMIFTTCAIFSIANASSEVSTVKTANQRNVAVESDAALKMKNLMISVGIYCINLDLKKCMLQD